MKPLGSDRWRAEFHVSKLGRYQYSVEGWIDRFRTWRGDLIKRINAGQDIHAELLIGAQLVEEAAQQASGEDGVRLHQWARTLSEVEDRESAMTGAVEEGLGSLVQRYPDRRLASRCEKDLAVVVEREKARFSTWYQLFPRSCSPQPGRHGTLRDCLAWLPYIASMGFDLVYLPPIHPIGRTFRKGKNNSVLALPDDVGSPWAIGSMERAMRELKGQYPEVIFLAKAFPRPHVMYRLAKFGFSQSYTYFTWRNTKQELIDYFGERTGSGVREYFRLNLWPNTPDILPEFLQVGGRPAFMIRLVLAATLEASYGIYGPAFEVCENTPREPGSEEYLNSEKYELNHRDLNSPGSLKDFIGRVNRIRSENPTLQSNHSLVFHDADNPALICYSKATDDLSNIIVVVVNLDAFHTQASWINLDLKTLGLAADRAFQAHDLLGEIPAARCSQLCGLYAGKSSGAYHGRTQVGSHGKRFTTTSKEVVEGHFVTTAYRRAARRSQQNLRLRC